MAQERPGTARAGPGPARSDPGAAQAPSTAREAGFGTPAHANRNGKTHAKSPKTRPGRTDGGSGPPRSPWGPILPRRTEGRPTARFRPGSHEIGPKPVQRRSGGTLGAPCSPWGKTRAPTEARRVPRSHAFLPWFGAPGPRGLRVLPYTRKRPPREALGRPRDAPGARDPERSRKEPRKHGIRSTGGPKSKQKHVPLEFPGFDGMHKHCTLGTRDPRPAVKTRASRIPGGRKWRNPS